MARGTGTVRYQSELHRWAESEVEKVLMRAGGAVGVKMRTSRHRKRIAVPQVSSPQSPLLRGAAGAFSFFAASPASSPCSLCRGSSAPSAFAAPRHPSATFLRTLSPPSPRHRCLSPSPRRASVVSPFGAPSLRRPTVVFPFAHLRAPCVRRLPLGCPATAALICPQHDAHKVSLN